MAKRKWFVTFEDLKNDCRTNPKYILFNPTKIELSKLKQHVLQQINLVSRSSLNVNQWQNSSKVIKWFKILKIKTSTFLQFLISKNFYLYY